MWQEGTLREAERYLSVAERYTLSVAERHLKRGRKGVAERYLRVAERYLKCGRKAP